MQAISELTSGSLPTGVVAVEGECEKHGTSTAWILPRVGPREWACGKCAMEAKSAEVDALERAERLATRQRHSNLPARYAGQKFVAETEGQHKARVAARSFRNVVTTSPGWAVLALIGGTGTGKTLLASELAESLVTRAQMSVRYCTGKEMIAEIQASYGAEGKSEQAELLRLTCYDLLVIDEIDAVPSKENAQALLGEVINRRYNAGKPVVIISNQQADQLPDFIGKRVASRLAENALVAQFDWEDHRGTL